MKPKHEALLTFCKLISLLVALFEYVHRPLVGINLRVYGF